MKRIIFIIIVFLFLTGWWMMHENSPTEKFTKKNAVPQKVLSPTRIIAYSEDNFVFVPYWSFSNEINIHSSSALIYFSVTATAHGIDTTDAGYRKIAEFQEAAKTHSQTYLAIQMTDSDINSKILQDTMLQNEIITQSTNLARENGFTGIVIDFETASLSFDSVTKKISLFIQKFADHAHSQNLHVSLALYGDTFYRARPYDVPVLAKNADNILIMAYDFTKARSNPGPNFPLNGHEMFGYDFHDMIHDFSQNVPASKLAVIFGMFGYDWPVDTDGKSVKNGKALSDRDIDQNFISACKYQKCAYVVDSTSAETKVEYTDINSDHHIIWFGNPDSVAQKKKYLESQGIKSTGYWAYSYY